ncbi:hypothetical protein MLD38_014549 [Melastoma candidum]|uniref:Uncharacterized protein n=1 Tax=Melastoma candidum TaxID=119954 RepID=A0ACB9RGU6_9MYRT|nr:hypothetical protein MLD38_014549 [Melastoma candidum]
MEGASPLRIQERKPKEATYLVHGDRHQRSNSRLRKQSFVYLFLVTVGLQPYERRSNGNREHLLEVEDQTPVAEGAQVFPLDAETQGEEAETPMAFHVHGLHLPPALGART